MNLLNFLQNLTTGVIGGLVFFVPWLFLLARLISDGDFGDLFGEGFPFGWLF